MSRLLATLIWNAFTGKVFRGHEKRFFYNGRPRLIDKVW